MLERKRITRGGFSLIELMIVVCVIAILAGIAGIQYSIWIRRYNVEREIRQMHADLMNARARAMTRNRLHFVTLTAAQYNIYEDTYDDNVSAYTPDGDKSLQETTPGDTVILEKRTDNELIYSLGGGSSKFHFKRNGLSSLNGTVRLASDVKADYDCIVLFSTRINIGKSNGSSCKAR